MYQAVPGLRGIENVENEWIAAAIKASTEGDLPVARRLLSDYVGRCPMDERGWLWLSRVVDHPAQQIESLQRALRINPFNDVARVELEAAIHFQADAHVRGAQPLPSAMSLLGGFFKGHFDENPERRSSFGIAQNSEIASQWTLPVTLLRSSLRIAFSLAGWVALAMAVCTFLILAIAIFPVFVGDRALVTMSGSMAPTIPTGAVVVTEPVPSAGLRVGDVIAFLPGPTAQEPIVHRVVKISTKGDQRYLTTRGDANKSADVEEVTLPPTAWRAWYSVPLAGYLIAFATSAIGIVTLIVLPILGLTIISMWDWLKKKPLWRRREYVPELPL